MKWRVSVVALLSFGLAAASACGGPDLKTSLKVVNVVSGYYDEGAPDGETRLLPSITFQLKNESTESLSNIDLAVNFWEVGADGEKDSKKIRGIEGTALAPGATGEPLTVRSAIGYKSAAAREDFFTNSLFHGFIVKFFAIYGGKTSSLGEQKIEARLLPTARRDGSRP